MLVLFSCSVSSVCGQVLLVIGFFYCLFDFKFYFDISFFNLMQCQFGGGGDFVYFYVIVYEVGYYVQNEFGIVEQVECKQCVVCSEVEQNFYSVCLEFQVDCFVGVWGNSVKGCEVVNLIEDDVCEVINIVVVIGDDILQCQGQGMVVFDFFIYGISQQCVNWFMCGFQIGNFNQCDIFSVVYNQF